MSVSHWLGAPPRRESWLRLILAMLAEEYRRWVCLWADHDIVRMHDPARAERLSYTYTPQAVCRRCGEQW